MTDASGLSTSQLILELESRLSYNLLFDSKIDALRFDTDYRNFLKKK